VKIIVVPNNSKITKGPDGKVYNSISEMCRAYGISTSLYRYRLKRGLSQEEALKSDIDKNYYRSKKSIRLEEICKQRGITPDTYHKRIEAGYSVDQALMPTEHNHKHKQKQVSSKAKPCVDFMGRKFNSKKDMCIMYGIDTATFDNRISHGWSLKDALTTNVGEKRKEVDFTNTAILAPNGERYKSVEDLCKAYGLDAVKFKYFINEGWNLEASIHMSRIKK